MHESETWWLAEEEIAVFRSKRATYGVKLKIQELMGMLGLNVHEQEKTVNRLPKTKGVLWHGNI